MNTSRNIKRLALEYQCGDNDRLVVVIRYGERERRAEATWQSIRAAMDLLLVPVSERISLLKQEYLQAPTEALFSEYIKALGDFTSQLQALEENQQSTAENDVSVSVLPPLTDTAKKPQLRVSKPMTLREHFTPVAEVTSHIVHTVLDNLVEHQYIAADSRAALASALGWSENRKRADSAPARTSNEMVIWQRNNYILRYMILTLLGKEETVLDRQVMSNGSLVMLQPGIYGRQPILAPPTANDRHWRLVASYFIDRKGRAINADSMRSTRYPSSDIERRAFQEELLSCFAPVFLSPANRRLVVPLEKDSSLASQRKLLLQGAAVNV